MTDPAGWPRFAEETTIAEDATLRYSWQRERRPFYVAVVLLEGSPPLQRRLAEVFAALSPWCRPAAPGQAHVTLAAIGADRTAARRAHGVLGDGCDVIIGGADSFSAAAFLQVCGSALDPMRQAVLAAAGPEVAAPREWVPQVTVGTYRRTVPRRVLAARLAPWRDLPPLLLRGRTGVMAVDRGSDVGGLLPVPPARFGGPPARQP